MRCFLVLLMSMLCVASQAADPPRYRVQAFEYGAGGNRFVEVDADGKLTREFAPLSIAVIFQPLENGNLLYAFGGSPTGVVEINSKGEEVWKYISKCPQVLGCERLANGNTLIGEQGPARAVEVDAKGTVVHVTPLTTTEEHFHRQVRNVHKLKNGNILAAHEGEGAVREYEPDGKIVWECKGVSDVVEALRLDNGNTLVGCGSQKRVIEVTPKGETVWELKAEDVPDLNLTWISSLQLLPNGNYLMGNFLRGSEGKGAHAFEVTRDKQVVWTFADHNLIKSLTTVRVSKP